MVWGRARRQVREGSRKQQQPGTIPVNLYSTTIFSQFKSQHMKFKAWVQ